MTAAEEILKAAEEDWDEEIVLDNAVQCALDYFESCRLLMSFINEFSHDYETDLYCEVKEWLFSQELIEDNSVIKDGGYQHLLWNKLPKEE